MINPGKSYFKTGVNSKGKGTVKKWKKKHEQIFSYLALSYDWVVWVREYQRLTSKKISLPVLRLIITTINLNESFRVYSGMQEPVFPHIL